jgi:F-type H+-transporting ATPase subunit b
VLQTLSAATVEAAKTNNPIIPNGTFIFEVIAFFLILYVLARKVVPRVSESMSRRQELIRTQIEDGRSAKERLEAAEAEYKQAVADTRANAARIREEARAQGQQIIDEMRAKAQEEAARISERAQARMETERQQLLVQLRAEVGELAVDLASRIVGESLVDQARQDRVVDRFLVELEQSAPAGQPATEPADQSAVTS